VVVGFPLDVGIDVSLEVVIGFPLDVGIGVSLEVVIGVPLEVVICVSLGVASGILNNQQSTNACILYNYNVNSKQLMS
jgi:hypothetical protein